jgi:5-methylcytosine-specific restriction endonuclease McrA
MTSNSEKQKRARERRKARIALMDKIPCACGCGTLIAPFNANLQPNRYVKGHQTRMHPSPHAGKPAHNRIGDTPLSAAERTKRNREKRQAKIAQMATLPCGCGCGTRIAPINKKGKRATYAPGHNQSRDRNKRWRGGVSPLRYGPGFTHRFKRLIRQRDNYTCQRCGITQAAHGRTLQVHHLDHNPLNNDPSNLVTACNKCNVWASNHRDDPFLP